MPDTFHKSCYTSRSSGYKYRTLSTNTGERKGRDDHDDNSFDKKFKDLKQVINSKIEKEVIETQKARASIKQKCSRIDAKINSMVELQNTVLTLRKDLRAMENTLVGIVDKVDGLEAVAGSESGSLKSRTSLIHSQPHTSDEKEVSSSVITHF